MCFKNTKYTEIYFTHAINIRIHMCYTNETNAYLDKSLAHVCGYFSSTVYKGYFFFEWIGIV